VAGKRNPNYCGVASSASCRRELKVNKSCHNRSVLHAKFGSYLRNMRDRMPS